MLELVTAQEAKVCTGCKELLSADRFYRYSKSGKLYGRCKPCGKREWGSAALQRAYALRDRIAQIKLETGCEDCGYRESALALQFDHVPERGPKLFQVSVGATGYKWERIVAEMAKCRVLCANCHAVTTGSRRTRRTFEAKEAA